MRREMTPEEIKRRMSNVRRKDTDIEVILRSALHRKGLRFRKNFKGLPGSPDIVFTRKKVVIFVDGDFWHGWRFEERGERLKPFWREKVARNLERDAAIDERLKELGWRVLHVWEHSIKRDLEATVTLVEQVLEGETIPDRKFS